MKLTGNFTESIKEYQSAIKIYEGPLAPSYREASNAYYLISSSHIFNCQEKSNQEQIAEKKCALKNLELSKKFLDQWIENNKDTALASDLDDAQISSIELQENIDATKLEIKELVSCILNLLLSLI